MKRPTDIPLDKAELLGVMLESLLYGFSLLMFGATVWTLMFQRSSHRVNYKMLIVACFLLLISTTHLVIDFVRTMNGFILYRDTYPGGPIAYFADVSDWTFVAENFVFTAQTLIGDGVVLYRCYVVWQSKLVMILPALLWCATAVTGIATPYTASKVTQEKVFGGRLSQWIAAYWITALVTNLVATLMLACRIWYIDQRTTRLRGNQESRLRPILRSIIDAGAIYTFTLIVALICFLCKSDVQYVLLDLVTPIIAITYYMVIIRIGLATRAQQTTHSSRKNTSTGRNVSTALVRRTQVHITQLTESRVDHVQHTCGFTESPRTSSELPRVDIKPHGVEETEAV
ncbi:hypothetical protein V8E55_008185 [Tylopilus felleus]